ncbi:MAG: Hsp20/alpha crystallin family protein [Myxococcales bacterium]
MAGDDKHASKGLSGILGGVAEFLERVEKLAESGAEVGKTGRTPEGRGVYGLSVKLGLGDQGFKVEPFGNTRRGPEAGQPAWEESREPLVDVFEEDDRTLIVAEMPGIEAEDIQVDLSGRTLTLGAERGDRKYRKTLEVPEGLQRDRLSVSCRNGIVEISAAKAGA